MSTHNHEQTDKQRPESWDGLDLKGSTKVPPEGQRHEDYFPPKPELKWHQKKGVRFASGVLTLTGLAGTYFAAQSGDTPRPDGARPDASAPAVPGEVTPITDTDPSALVGTPKNDSLEVLNTSTTPEQIQDVISTPIDASLSPTEAFEELSNYDRAFGNGGTLVPYDSAFPETAESQAQGEAIWNNTYSNIAEAEFKQNQFDVRAKYAAFFQAYKEALGVTVTVHDEWKIKGEPRMIGESTYEIDFVLTTYTNVREFDDIAPKPADELISNIDQMIAGRDGVMVISNQTGQWLRDSYIFS